MPHPLPVAYFTKESNPGLANLPSSFNGGLAELGLTPLVEQATDTKDTRIVDQISIRHEEHLISWQSSKLLRYY